jgi:hypothetical protein
MRNGNLEIWGINKYSTVNIFKAAMPTFTANEVELITTAIQYYMPEIDKRTCLAVLNKLEDKNSG